MRSLAAVLVAFLFIIPIPALAQTGDVGHEGVQGHVPFAGPVGTATFRSRTVPVDFGAPVLYSGVGTGGATSISVPGLRSIDVPGLPRLPVRIVNLEFPAGTMVEDVVIDHDPPSSMVISGELDLGPPAIAIGPFGSLGPVPIERYYDGEMFPADWYTYDVRRGLNDDGEATVFVNVFIYPVRTEGVNGGHRISNLSSMDVEVSYQEAPEGGPSSRLVSRADQYDMVIICSGDFADELEVLAEHKRATGMDTIVVSLSDIYDGTYFDAQGRDDQERIKYFVKDALEQWGIKYVLLGGDVDKVPTRHVEIYDDYDDDGSWYADGKWVPTDQYFADIYDGQNNFDDWDDNSNNVFGQWTGGFAGYSVDDPDYYSDVYIGRLPASNSVELNVIINKIISYENSTNWNWFYEAGLAGLDTFASDPSGVPEGEYAMTKIGEILQPRGFSLIKLYESLGTLSSSAIVSTVNGGVGIMTLAGHGAPDAWGSETALYFSNSNINSMNNGIMLPVGGQSACSTGSFDNEDTVHNPGWNPPESMAERFVLKSGGGYISDVGSSRVAYGYWGTDTVNHASDFFNKLYWKALADGHGTPGKMLDKARTDYMKAEGLSYVGDYKHMSAYNLFGDPSTAIGGIGISIGTDDGIPQIPPGGTAVFNVSVRNVGIWDGTGVDISVDGEDGWSVDLSSSQMDLDSGQNENLTLTVTAPSDAASDTVGTFDIKAVSDFNDRSATSTVKAKVKQTFGLRLTSDANDRPSVPGGDVEFNLSIRNTGNGNDGATISASDVPSGWGLQLDHTHVEMEAFTTVGSKVSLALPDQVLAASYWFNITAVLDGAPITKVLTLRVDVQPVHDIAMVCTLCSSAIDPGEGASMGVNVTNLGNVPDNITVTATVPDQWALTITTPVLTIAPYEVKGTAIEVVPNAKALAGEYVIEVKASIEDKEVTVDLEVTVKRVYGLELTVSEPSRTVEGGSEAVFEAAVKNTGNGPETVDMSSLKAPVGWAAQGEVQSFNIMAYSTYRLKLYVTTTWSSLAGEYTVDMMAQAQDGPKVKDDVTLKVTVAERIDGRASLGGSTTQAYPGTSFVNTVSFENMGNVYENISLVGAEDDGNFTVRSMDPRVLVPPGTEAEVAFTLRIPDDALAGPHTYMVLIERDKGQTISLSGLVDVVQVHRFDVVLEGETQVVERGAKIIRKVTVTNTGNGEDTFTVELLGETRAWANTLEHNFTLEPGRSRSIYVSITPPTNAAPEEHVVLVDVTSECGSTKEVIVDYRITAPDEEVTVGTTVGSVFPWLMLLVVISFAIGRTAMELRKGRHGHS